MCTASPPPRPPAKAASFHWKVKPLDGIIAGRIYTDGSALDGPTYEMMRCGWSFVVLDDDDAIIASAYGVTPPWIRDIGGAEGWALLQAAHVAFPGACSFTSDCKVIVDTLQLGRRKAMEAGSTHARIYALLFSGFEDTPLEAIIWMPAHQKNGAAEVRVKSNGQPLTAVDIAANEEADVLAKRGVEEHQVPFRVRDEAKRCHEMAKQRAMWVARATVEANNLPNYPYSDSESSKQAAEEARRARRQAANGSKVKVAQAITVARPPALGGHFLVAHVWGKCKGWKCMLCRETSSSWKRFAPARCKGSAVEKWADKAIEAANREEVTGAGHHRMLSGEVIWCRTCGCYADARARGLTEVCKGKPSTAEGGGLGGQLSYLRANRHPRTREWLPPPIDEGGFNAGANWSYSNLPAYRTQHSVRTASVKQVVDAARSVALNGSGGLAGTASGQQAMGSMEGKSAAQKMQDRLERIRAKEKAAKLAARAALPALRRIRGKQRPGLEWMRTRAE